MKRQNNISYTSITSQNHVAANTQNPNVTTWVGQFYKNNIVNSLRWQFYTIPGGVCIHLCTLLLFICTLTSCTKYQTGARYEYNWFDNVRLFFGSRPKSEQMAGHAYVVMTQQRTEEAIEECDYVISHDSLFWLPYYVKGMCAFQDSAYDEAFALFDKSSDCFLDEDRYYVLGRDTVDICNVWCMMGESIYYKYLDMNEPDSLVKAKNYLELALSYDYASTMVKLNCYESLYWIYLFAEDPEKAKKCIEEYQSMRRFSD